MMGNVDGPVVEVIGSDPDEESPPPGWRPGALVVAALLVALVVGALAGADLTRAVDRHRVAVIPPTRLTAAVVVPAGGDLTYSRDASGWVTAVDVVVVDAGPATIKQVLAQWASPYETPLGSPVSVQALDRLVRGVPQTINLLLYRSCSSGAADVPTLQLTWKGSSAATPVTPVGLDRVWTDLAGQCVGGDAPINALDITVSSSAAVGRSAQRVDLKFLNQGDQALSLSVLGLRGGVQLESGATLVVGPNTATTVRLQARVTDCQTAVENLSGAGLVYRVAASGHASVEPTYTSDALSHALAALVYRACAKR